MISKPKIIPGIHLLFRRVDEESGENEYLLHKRIGTNFFDGYYSVPGGHIERYETPLECAMREAKEELGITLKPNQLEVVNLIYRIKEKEGEVRPDLCFLIKQWKGTISNGEPKKHKKPEWYLISKFPNKMVPYVKQAIIDIERGVFLTQSFC